MNDIKQVKSFKPTHIWYGERVRLVKIEGVHVTFLYDDGGRGWADVEHWTYAAKKLVKLHSVGGAL